MPPAKVLGVSKPVADFISWGITRVFVVNERARDEIKGLDPEAVEFLPFHNLGRHRTYVANVVRCEDYLDHGGSDLNGSNPRYVFRRDLPQTLPAIFKCKDASNDVFVTAAFGNMIVHAALRGAALADPAERPFPLILARADMNRFPGVPE